MPEEEGGSPHKRGLKEIFKKHWIEFALGAFALVFVWFMMRRQSSSPQAQAYDPTAGQGSAGGGTSGGGGAPDFSSITDAITAAQQQEQQDLQAVMAGQTQNQQDLLAAMEADRQASDSAQQGYFAQLAEQLGSIFQGAQAAASYPSGGSANPQTELLNASSALTGAAQSLLPQSSPTVFGGQNINPVTGAYINPSGPTPFFPGAVLNQSLAQQVGALVTNTGTYYGTPASQAAQTTYQQVTQPMSIPNAGTFAGVSAPAPSSILKALGASFGYRPGQQIKPY